MYNLALDNFTGYAITREGINTYLNSLTCGNAKHNYYRVIKALCRWLYHTDQVTTNLIEKVLPPHCGWGIPNMARHYAASLTFDDALKIYKAVNSDACYIIMSLLPIIERIMECGRAGRKEAPIHNEVWGQVNSHEWLVGTNNCLCSNSHDRTYLVFASQVKTFYIAPNTQQ